MRTNQPASPAGSKDSPRNEVHFLRLSEFMKLHENFVWQ